MSHTLAQGATIASKYGRFGIANRRMIPPLDRTFAFIIGKSNSGKTSIPASYEGALICNADGSSTPMTSKDAPPPKAQFFPGFNAEGQAVDANDRPMVLEWSHFEAIKDQLIEAAVKDQPRPRLVVGDSVTTMMGLIKAHLVKKAGKAEWNQLHGEAAWEQLYSTLFNWCAALRPHYGVWLIGHLTDRWKKEGESDRKVIELTTPPGFLPRFFPLFELCIGVEKRLTPETKKVVREIDVGGGKKIQDEQKITEMVPRVFLVGETPELAGLYKQRICLPVNVELPPNAGWDTLQKVYQESATPSSVAA